MATVIKPDLEVLARATALAEVYLEFKHMIPEDPITELLGKQIESLFSPPMIVHGEWMDLDGPGT